MTYFNPFQAPEDDFNRLCEDFGQSILVTDTNHNQKTIKAMITNPSFSKEQADCKHIHSSEFIQTGSIIDLNNRDYMVVSPNTENKRHAKYKLLAEPVTTYILFNLSRYDNLGKYSLIKEQLTPVIVSDLIISGIHEGTVNLPYGRIQVKVPSTPEMIEMAQGITKPQKGDSWKHPFIFGNRGYEIVGFSQVEEGIISFICDVTTSGYFDYVSGIGWQHDPKQTGGTTQPTQPPNSGDIW